MSGWSESELIAVGDAEELEIASQRADGSLRKWVTIWMVRVGDAIYVRPVKGREGWWFKGVIDQHAGRITAGGVTKDVTFAEVPEADAVNEAIDAEYRTKYARYPQYWPPVVTPLAKAATIRLEAR